MTPEATTAETMSASAEPSETMSEAPVESEAPMEEAGTIVDVAAGNPDFETLVAAVTAADLVETLSGEGPFTVFAPTDEAFDALPEGLLDALLLPENKDALTSILTYHVVSGEVMAADVTAGDVATVEGSTIAITTDSLAWMQGGSSTAGSRTLALGSVATAVKVTATRWVISGVGLS